MRWGAWVEMETPHDDEFMLIHPGWTNDTDSLFNAIRQAGWFVTNSEAYDAAESAELSWGWAGVDEAGELRECSMDGSLPDDNELDYTLQDVESVTFARVVTQR